MRGAGSDDVAGTAVQAVTDIVIGALAAGEVSETAVKEVKETLGESVDGAKEVIHKL